MSEELTQLAWNALVRLIERRDYSEKEIRERLKRRKHEDSYIDSACERAKKLGYLDDERLTKRLIEGLSQGQRGPRWIAQKLKARKLQSSTEGTKELLSAHCSTDLQSEQATQWLLRQRRLLQFIEASSGTLPFPEKQKWLARLARRGFSIQSAQVALKRVLEISREI